MLRYSYSEDRDLYVAGDLYQNDVMTPAMIVVPRRKGRKCYPDEKEGKTVEREKKERVEKKKKKKRSQRSRIRKETERSQ